MRPLARAPSRRFSISARREPLVDRLALVVDAGRARLGAVGECHQQVGQLGVAMLVEELCHGVASAPIARSAGDRARRRANVRKGKRAVSRHPRTIAEQLERSKNRLRGSRESESATPLIRWGFRRCQTVAGIGMAKVGDGSRWVHLMSEKTRKSPPRLFAFRHS